MKNINNYPTLMLKNEVMKYFNISLETLKRWVKRDFPVIYLGGQKGYPRFYKEDIKKWLKEKGMKCQ